MAINGKTRLTGLFGYPVEHTLSPAMHNAAFAHLGLDYCYVPFSVHPDRLSQAVEGIRALSLRGVNITVPHKERVIPLLDEIDEEAAFIGAVNTIQNDEGRLTGFNADGRGFMQSLAEAGIDAKGKKVLIVGAGGGARSIGYYLCKEAEKVYFYDLDAMKARSLTQHLKTVSNNAEQADTAWLKDRNFVKGAGIIINATPLGLRPEDPSPLDVSLINQSQAVCDLIYKDTALLKAATAAGCRTMNGLGMLLWQGVLAFEIWTGIKPPVEIMREALLRRMAG
jgi:shikimate dehydrogenase